MTYDLIEIGNLMLRKGGSVNPLKFQDETFELYSIPSYDKQETEIIKGKDIGSTKQIVQCNDVMISKIVPHIRRAWVVNESKGYRQIASGEWIVFRSEKIYPNYLRHLLISDFFNKKFMETVSGVGGSLLRARPAFVGKILIPLPPLEEQRRIASILDKADAIRQKRQQAIAKLDELLQATFIDMFGDPLENSKKFPIKKLSEFYIDPKNGTKCGPFGSALKREEYTDSGIPVWSMDVLSLKGEFQDQPSLWISDEKYSKLEAYAVIDGDILISRAGTVGKMGVARSRFEKSIISTNLIRLRFGNLLLPDYFVSLMTFCKTRLPRLKTGADGAFTHMNTGILDNLEFPYPPIEIQNEYMKIYTNIHKQKEVLLNSASQFDDLFNALQQKAFNGTL